MIMKKNKSLLLALMFFVGAFYLPVNVYAEEIDLQDPGTIDTQVTIPSAQTTIPESQSALPSNNPFTPSGTGTVIDNATQADGKEFYTIITADDTVYYLIIDRQRENENVYFLNAVTENDLLPLAKKGDGKSTGIIPTTVPDVGEQSSSSTSPNTEKESESKTVPVKSNNTSYIIIGVTVIFAGVFGVMKLKKGKDQSISDEEYEEEQEVLEDDYEEE